MTPVVVVIVVVLAVAAFGGLTYFAVGRIVRHWSRTREQANIVFAVQMELMALVHATVQRCDAADPDGQRGAANAFDAESARNQAQACASLRKNLALLKDARLRQITRDVLDCSDRLSSRPQAADAARIRAEVQSLQASFRTRSNEVVRDMRLGRA